MKAIEKAQGVLVAWLLGIVLVATDNACHVSLLFFFLCWPVSRVCVVRLLNVFNVLIYEIFFYDFINYQLGNADIFAGLIVMCD